MLMLTSDYTAHLRRSPQARAPRAGLGGRGGRCMPPGISHGHLAPPGRAVQVPEMPKQYDMPISLHRGQGNWHAASQNESRYRPGTHQHPPWALVWAKWLIPTPPWAFLGPAAPGRPASENRPRTCPGAGPIIWTPIDRSMRHQKCYYFESRVPCDG